MSGRRLLSAKAKYGFNGKLKDNEDHGEGNAYDFGARIYDPRLGKWLALDPTQKKYAGFTPYGFSFNSPLIFNDPDGKDGRLTVDNEKKQVTLETTVFIYGGDASIDYDQMAKDYNKAFSDLNTTKKVGDWTVKVDVKFVVAKQIDEQMAAMNEDPKGNISTNTTESIKNKESFGFKPGDNTLKINTGIGMGSRVEGNAGLGFNEAASASKDPSVGIHEIFHLLGFIDRYDAGSGLEVADYQGDVLSNGTKNNFSEFHYVDILDFALKQGISGTAVMGEKTETTPSKTEIKNGTKTTTLGSEQKSSNLIIDNKADIKNTKQRATDKANTTKVIKQNEPTTNQNKKPLKL